MANTIMIGNIEASAIMIGNSAVSAVYIGYDKIYPSVPVDYSTQYLTFKVIEGGTVTIKASNTNIAKTIKYSLNNGRTWRSMTTSTTAQELGGTLNVGDKVLVKGTNTAYGTSSYYNSFGGTAKVNVYGNIMSLISGDSFANSKTLTANYTFNRLFSLYNNLLSAENLILPATTLADYCYSNMFNSCKNLTTAPELPATTLTSSCYSNMFNSCKNLTTAPELPATTLTSSCYSNMFYGCTSLVNAPELPATTLTSSCYNNMFRGCTSLNYIKAMFTTTPSTTYTYNWVNGVAETGTFVKNKNATWDVTGVHGIPTGWTVQDDGAPTDNWVLVNRLGFESPRKIKVDYSLIVDTGEFQEDYNFNSNNLDGSYSILYINQPTAEFLIQELGHDEETILELLQKIVVFDSNNGVLTDVLEDGVEYSEINNVSLTDFSIAVLNDNSYLYATE